MAIELRGLGRREDDPDKQSRSRKHNSHGTKPTDEESDTDTHGASMRTAVR